MTASSITLEEQLVDALISTISRLTVECGNTQRWPRQEQYETLAQGLHFLEWNGPENLYQKLIQGWLMAEQCSEWLRIINVNYPREAIPLALFCAVQTDNMEHNQAPHPNNVKQSHYQKMPWDAYGKKLVPNLYPNILLNEPCMSQVLNKTRQQNIITEFEYNSLINSYNVHQNLNQHNNYETFQYLVREFKNPTPILTDIEVKSDIFVQP